MYFIFWSKVYLFYLSVWLLKTIYLCKHIGYNVIFSSMFCNGGEEFSKTTGEHVSEWLTSESGGH